LLVLILLIELLPVLTIVAISFVREGSWTWQLLPTGFTVENYTRLLSDPDVFLPVRNSAAMGCLTVVASVLLGTGAAYTITKGIMRRFRGPLDFLLSLPFSIPGTVVAIYLIVAYSAPTVFSGGQVLLGTFWILPLAYFIRTYPLLFRSVSSSLEKIDESVLEASSTLGAGSSIRLRRIILPIVFPSIVGGSLLVMNAALGEFVSSILLYTHSNRPLSIEILSQLRGYNLGSAASYGVVLFVLVLSLAFLSDRLMRRHDRDRVELSI
jgi:iron(III) transport system permease protein